VFDPPQGATLWQLPEAVEKEFETRWERWLDQADQLKPFFLELEALKEAALKTVLQSLDLSFSQGCVARLKDARCP
jgi:hypothetical protein